MYLYRAAGLLAAAAAVFVSADVSNARAAEKAQLEEYVREPLPPGFQVVRTDVDGPLFANAAGQILYRWPFESQRNGTAGEQQGKPTCDDTHYRTSAGLMSPYPAGLELPEADSRPSCIQQWPVVYAEAGAKPVGKWSIVTRKDGRAQWAYEGYALYTSVLDHEPGVPVGAGNIHAQGKSGTLRHPIGPKTDIPSQFAVATIPTGRLLVLADGQSVYSWDKDSAARSSCEAACLRNWAPVLAGEAAPRSHGDWAVIERTPGIRQWTFRAKPLYTHLGKDEPHSFEGSDVPGWHNVYTQAAPPPPKGFTVQDMAGGQVVADSRGHTIYVYYCVDDAADQLSCDHPTQPQEYRFAVCGGFDLARCLATFPYVIADKNAKSDSKIWSIMDIDPKTGHLASPGQAGALHVWAYRERPVYTFARDAAPGDTNADSWGEKTGWRNGYHAFFVREEFRRQY